MRPFLRTLFALVAFGAYAWATVTAFTYAAFIDLGHSKGAECCLVATTHYQQFVLIAFFVVFPALFLGAYLWARRQYRQK
jgi:hypothetical protein